MEDPSVSKEVSPDLVRGHALKTAQATPPKHLKSVVEPRIKPLILGSRRSALRRVSLNSNHDGQAPIPVTGFDAPEAVLLLAILLDCGRRHTSDQHAVSGPHFLHAIVLQPFGQSQGRGLAEGTRNLDLSYIFCLKFYPGLSNSFAVSCANNYAPLVCRTAVQFMPRWLKIMRWVRIPPCAEAFILYC